MKIVTIVGARPQFIKAAVFSRELRIEHTEILVHTGQHYDWNMSDVFFDELGIPSPDYNLGIGSATHGKQTGEMLAAIEQVLLTERPDWVIVYGDTNSTLAGALAAVKLHTRVAHVEAGLRSFNRNMPEEINRVLTDHISDLLLCPTQTAVDNLSKEGINQGVHLAGDVMYDSLFWAIDTAEKKPNILHGLNLQSKSYVLTTIHRAENTDDPSKLEKLLKTFDQINEKMIWPVHPRTRKVIENLQWNPADHIQLIDPVGYLDMAILEKNAKAILTDSGGMQKEAYWLGVPCITLREETEWVETVNSGWNHLVGSDAESIIRLLSSIGTIIPEQLPVTNPFKSSKVIELMENLL
jgi:UDP-N-acetylglucosamine 2-epimerase